MRFDEDTLDYYVEKIEKDIGAFLGRRNDGIAMFKICAFLHVNQNEAQVIKAYAERAFNKRRLARGEYRADWERDTKNELGIDVPKGDLSWSDFVAITQKESDLLNAKSEKEESGKGGNNGTA